MKNWNFVQVSQREFDSFVKDGTPVEIPFGLALPNEGVILTDETGNSKPGIYDLKVRGVRPLTTYSPIKKKPPNKDLHLLYDLLQSDEVDIIIVDGLFGTGKTSTVMAHACGNLYDQGFKMVITKPHVPAGKSYGHLPGELKEKMFYEMRSFYQYIQKFQQKTVEDLLLTGQVELAPFEYVRGMDYPDSWVIVDESQNLSREEAITIASRVADGGKLILLGDTSNWQKDTKHKLDGLTFLYNLLKDEGIIGYVEMKTEQHVLRGRVAKALARALAKESTPS